MTKDERIEAIRKLAARHPDPTTWLTGDINFLLAELDAAEARVQRLTDTLRSIARNSCCDRCQEAAMVARAALAEGEQP